MLVPGKVRLYTPVAVVRVPIHIQTNVLRLHTRGSRTKAATTNEQDCHYCRSMTHCLHMTTTVLDSLKKDVLRGMFLRRACRARRHMLLGLLAVGGGHWPEHIHASCRA